ncbi:MAG: ParB/RepB/Spo0J family partition protein, partial [Deltaproteobacteria bacterium]|nr:ParB/RepB/Spo0J family partition protein [Deltaproteobacteria bacterium]
MTLRKKALGKGLSALLPDLYEDDIEQVDVKLIKSNPFQPRGSVNASELKELAHSIKEKGLIQPVVVRQKKDYYELVVGERRWKAAVLAGLSKVPAIVKDFSDIESVEVAIIENVQRKNLSPIEEAMAYKRLIENFGYTQEKVAQKIGKNRTTVANILRILDLPQEIVNMIHEGKISQGHARALLALKNDKKKIYWANEIKRKKLTVREIENIKDRDEIKRISQSISSKIELSASIKGTLEKGKLEIRFNNNKEFKRLLSLFDFKHAQKAIFTHIFFFF